MNNRQAGRRRGRGGQRSGGNPGRPDNGNRIDNRARGNAAQLLEKYKNLARDSHMSGDRVTTEYYLQFADHYFRVLSESRSRAEDNGQRRPNTDITDEDEDDYGFEGEVASPSAYTAQPVQQDEEREPRREGGQRDGGDQPERAERQPREERGDRPRRMDGERGERPRRGQRNDEGEGAERAERQPREEARTGFVSRDAEPREDRPVPANDEAREQPRRRGRPRRETVAEVATDGFDAALLPPALNVEAAPAPEAQGDGEAERPRRRRRVRSEDEAIPPAA
jgi:hypothetical protein